MDPNNTQSDANVSLADLDALITELGASYPILAYAGPADEGDESPLDPVIFAGIASP